MIQIDKEHNDYSHQKAIWAVYRDLYAGGEQFKFRANNYLMRRQKEPLDVYGERLGRVFYENYIGSIVDWYTSTLFRREPSLQYEGGLEAGKTFLAEFSENCDRRGTRLSGFFERALREALVMGVSYVLIDFPRSAKAATNRAEEDSIGLSRGFLIRYDREDLINWSLDEHGQYEWIVLRNKIERQPDVNSSAKVTETWWHYYDKTHYKSFRRVDGGEGDAPIELTGQGLHALSHENRVPVFPLKVSDGLWLMNKAAHLQLEHFNKSNALGWAITMGLFAMPVIYSDREWNQIVGESYFIQLSPGDRFGWAEPDGKVYQIAAVNLETLKEEIYRVCYLSQASGELTGGQAQSALSKQIDFTITQEVLRAYGTQVKTCIRDVLTAICNARQDGGQISVTGLDELDINDFGTELQQATNLLALGIDSPTLKRQIFQRLALKYLSDARQETKDQIAREIEAQIPS